MLQNYSRYRILQEFFDFPSYGFLIRELCRRTKITQPSVVNHLKALLKEKLIIKEKARPYPVFKANRDNEIFRILKVHNLILRIKISGLLDYIWDNTFPDTIILFGSSARGEDIENSDIDIFVQAKEKELVLEKYEKLLNRKISLFFKERFSKLNPELKNNIINGIVLKGYLKVF